MGKVRSSMAEKYEVKTYDNNEIAVFDESIVKYFGTQRLSYVSKEFMEKVYTKKNLLKEFFSVIENMSKEEAKSLLLIRVFLLNDSWYLTHLSNHNYPVVLAQDLKHSKFPLQEFNDIIEYKLRYCVHDAYLNWFKKDLRSALFIASLAKSQLRNNTFKGKVDLINSVTEIIRYEIHIFNENYSENLPEYAWYRDIHGDTKIAHIEFVKDIYLKNRTSEKEVRWIDSSNKQQIEWMYSYLEERLDKGFILKGIFFPENINEKYQHILASLDLLTNKSDKKYSIREKKRYKERGYVISSMKNAWQTQNNYNKSKPLKKERHVKIFKDNYEILDKIVKNTNSTDIRVVNNYLSRNCNSIDSAKDDIADELQSIKLSKKSFDKLTEISGKYNVSPEEMMENLIEQKSRL